MDEVELKIDGEVIAAIIKSETGCTFKDAERTTLRVLQYLVEALAKASREKGWETWENEAR